MSHLSRIAVICSILAAGCTFRTHPGPLVERCNEVPPELSGCSSCHAELASIAGWYEQPIGSRYSCLPSDMNGRQAFYVLFTQSNSLSVPEHAAPYEWAQECFCRDGSSSNPERRCYTLAGEFETDCP